MIVRSDGSCRESHTAVKTDLVHSIDWHNRNWHRDTPEVGVRWRHTPCNERAPFAMKRRLYRSVRDRLREVYIGCVCVYLSLSVSVALSLSLSLCLSLDEWQTNWLHVTELLKQLAARNLCGTGCDITARKIRCLNTLYHIHDMLYSLCILAGISLVCLCVYFVFFSFFFFFSNFTYVCNCMCLCASFIHSLKL